MADEAWPRQKPCRPLIPDGHPGWPGDYVWIQSDHGWVLSPSCCIMCSCYSHILQPPATASCYILMLHTASCCSNLLHPLAALSCYGYMLLPPATATCCSILLQPSLTLTSFYCCNSHTPPWPHAATAASHSRLGLLHPYSMSAFCCYSHSPHNHLAATATPR